MNPGTLAFFAQREPALPSLEHTIGALTQIGLLGEPLPHVSHHHPPPAARAMNGGKKCELLPPGHRFCAGPRFLQLISFLGCSPQIRLTPDNGGDFCHIQLLSPLPHPRLMVGSNTRPPRCPRCRAPMDDWQARLETIGAHLPPEITCPGCRQPVTPHHLLWRQQAGLGQRFILVHGIFPGEAVPVDELMHCLTQTGGIWDYCYLQTPRWLGD